MEKNENFIFYRSFFESIHIAPETERLAIYEDLMAICLGDKAIDDVPYPRNMFINQCLASVEYAKKRYETSIENGKKGGRPPRFIKQEEAEALYAKLKSWGKVAEALDVSIDTLRKARYLWYGKDYEKPKNPNDNVNDNDNVNVNYQLTNNKAVEGSLEAPSPAEEKKPTKYKGDDGVWRVMK